MGLHPNHPIKLAVVLVVLGSGWARAADSPPVAALKEQGIVKSGRVFVIEEAEKPVLEKIKEVRGVANIYTEAADRVAAAEQADARVARLEQDRLEIQASISASERQIAVQQREGGMVAGRPNRALKQQNQIVVNQMTGELNAIKAKLDQVVAELGTIKANIPQPKARAEQVEDAKKKGEAFKAALAELRPMVDEVTKKYADVAADPAVKASLDEIAKVSKAPAKLGPSEAFQAGTKALEQAERRFLGKKTAPAAKKKAKAK